MENVDVRPFGKLLVVSVSLLVLMLSTSVSRAEMTEMSDSELSEVTGRAGTLASVHEKARELNLFEKIGASSDELRAAMEEKVQEKYSDRLPGDVLENNKLMNQFVKTFVGETLRTMQSTGGTPVSITDRGSLKLSSELSSALFKTAIKQSFQMVSNPGRALPGETAP
jgi:hypothetical protein